KRHAKGAPFTGTIYVDWALKNPAAYRLMFDTQQPTAMNYPELVEAMTRAKGTMTASWSHMKQLGKFKGDTELAAYMMWSAKHVAVILQLSCMMQSVQDAS